MGMKKIYTYTHIVVFSYSLFPVESKLDFQVQASVIFLGIEVVSLLYPKATEI